MSIKASAALFGGRYLTPAETVDVLGNTLKVTYFNGTDTTETNAVYVGADTVGNVEYIHVTDYLQSGLTTVIYSFSGSVVNNPQYIAVEFPAEFAILETEQVYTVAGITASGSGISNDVYQSPQWVWTMAGARQVFEGRHDYGMHYRTELSYNFANGEQFDYIPVSWTHQGETSAFSQRLYFSYASAAQDGKYYISIGVPYITASGEIDTVSGTTGTNPDGSINVDLSETNGLLSGIADVLSGIVSGIADIFVPDQDFLLGWKDDMGGILDDTFGKYTEIDDILERVKNTLVDTQPNAVVRFPGVHPPGSSFSIPAQDVNAVPSALSDFVDYIKFGFDILATCLFVNSCKRKWDEVVLGKTVVEIEGSD